MSLSDLPAELVLQVSRHVDHADLKSLHLTSSRLSRLITEVLFETLHLTPNSLSYNRALQVATSESHKQHVKAITYHVGILYSDFEGFDDFKKQLPLANKLGHAQDPQETSEKMLWYYSCWLEEIDAQTVFACQDEHKELLDLCSRFPNLESINTIMDGYTDMIAEPTDYIGRRTGMQSGLQSEGLHFNNLFLATQHRPLLSISGRSLTWDIFSDLINELDLNQTRSLQTIKSLELGLFNSEYMKLVSDDIQQSFLVLSYFSKFLHATRHVSRLALDFDELPYTASSPSSAPGINPLASIYETAFAVHWTGLHSLELRGLAVDETALSNFLLAQRQTLRTLHLGDIDLTGNRGLIDPEDIPRKDPYGSVITLFDTLSRGLELQNARLSGNFINRVDEAWYVSTNTDGNVALKTGLSWGSGPSIVERLQDYLCRRRSSPFPNAFLDQRLQSQSRQNFRYSGPLIEAFVDESWQWCAEMIPDT